MSTPLQFKRRRLHSTTGTPARTYRFHIALAGWMASIYRSVIDGAAVTAYDKRRMRGLVLSRRTRPNETRLNFYDSCRMMPHFRQPQMNKV
jgi:hypothetical protein